MAVENLIALPIAFADRDPAIPGSGTPFDAAHFNPNFEEIEAKYNNHRHSEFDTFALVGDFNTLEANFNAHTADTTAVHGITDTSLLVYTDDARLSDMRVPTDGSVTNAKVAPNAAISYNKLNLGASVQLTDLNFVPTTLTSPGTFLARTQDAAGTLVLASRVGTDANDRFAISTDGTMQWGSGAAPFGTTNLYRSGGLKTDGSFFVGGSMVLANFDSALKAENADVGTRNFIFAKMGTDTVDRFTVDVSGRHQWGAGTVATDVNLYRQAAGALRTDQTFVASQFQATINSSTSRVFGAQLSADTQYRYTLDNTGKMLWGDGTNAVDTDLYRSASGALKTDGQFYASQFYASPAAVGNSAINMKTSADTNQRLIIYADGKHGWGSGSGAEDTNLYRIGASSLKTDGHLTVGANLLVRGATSQVVLDSQNSSINTVFAARVSGDAYSRVAIRTDGLIRFGTGAVDLDTNLYRAGTSQLKTDSTLIALGGVTNTAFVSQATTGWAFSVQPSANTQPFLTIGAIDGKLAWGDGTNARDTYLYRGGAGVLKSDGGFTSSSTSIGFNFNPATAAGNALFSIIGADTQPKFAIQNDGAMLWGLGGASATDVRLYRRGPNEIGTTNTMLSVQRSTSTAWAIATDVPGDANRRFIASANGQFTWGDGTSTGDTFLQRVSSGVLMIGTTSSAGRLNVMTAAGGAGTPFAVFNTTDAQPRFTISGDGKINWGAGGSLASDVNLYRASANVLKTDVALSASGSLTTNGLFTTNRSTAGQYAVLSGSLVDTAVGAVTGLGSTTYIVPSLDSAAEFRSNVLSATVDTPSTHNFSAPIKGAHIEARWQGAGSSTSTLYGVYGTITLPAATQNFGTLANVSAVAGQVVEFAPAGTVGTVTNAYVLHAITTQKTNVNFQTVVGVEVPSQTVGSVANYGVRISKSSTASLLLSGTDSTKESGISFNLDTWLYRAGVGLLQSDGEIRAKTSSTAFASINTGDAHERWSVSVSGGMTWGDGTNNQDTTLARGGANTLQLGTSTQAGRLNVIGASSSGVVFGAEAAADANMRFLINSSGGLFWGDGTLATDTSLQRTGVGVLALGTSTQAGRLIAYGATAGGSVFSTRVGANTNDSLTVQANGVLYWGSGTAALDTNLYRSAAGVLKTDTSLVVGGTFNIASYQVLNATADPGVAAAGSGRLYLKNNGAGKMQLVVQMPTGAPIVLATEA